MVESILMNIIMVQFIGLYGIILSTIISYVFISMPWLIYNLFKFLYNESLVLYLRDIVIYIIIAILSIFITALLCEIVSAEGMVELVIKGVICIIIPLIIECIVFGKKKEFEESIILVKKMIKRR